MGTHLGRFTTVRMAGSQQICRFVLKGDLAVGDRLRLHLEPSGERTPYRLKNLFVGGVQQEQAVSGEKVSLALPENFTLSPGGHVEVYKVDSGSGGLQSSTMLPSAEIAQELVSIRRNLSRDIQRIIVKVCGDETSESSTSDETKGIKKGKPGGRPAARKGLPLEWWLRIDSVKMLLGDMDLTPDRILLNFDKYNLSQAGKIKSVLGSKARMVVWALPPLIMENEVSRYHKQIALLLRSGFRSFQLGHISQTRLFGQEKVQLYADYTCNLLNSQAVALLSEIRFSRAQAAIEVDRPSLGELLADKGKKGLTGEDGRRERSLAIGLTVYATPALYTSRLAAPHFHYERQIQSPKNEAYVIKKMDGCTQTFAEKPFSLLPYLQELRDMGLDYVVVDLRSSKIAGKNLQELQERLANTGRYGKLSTFNYLGKLE
jgi:U32 family peptidase